MEHKIIVAGIGPGHPDYVVPKAARCISEAQILVGGARALSEFGRNDGTQEQFAIKGDIEAVLDFIEEKLPISDVVVMVSGDPGYYSMLDSIRKRFAEERLVVIPGISSVQMAFARLSLPWQDGEFISMHGRQVEDYRLSYRKGRLLAFLTDKANNSHTIPARLLSLGWPAESRFYVCSRLSYEDEVVESLKLADYQLLEQVYTACVLVVKA